MKMIMDETVCDEQKSVQFLISSDTYYGFIPSYCVQDNQQDLSRWNPWRNCRLEALPWKQQWYNEEQQQQEDVNMSLCRNRKRSRHDNDKGWPIEERKRPRKDMATSALLMVQEAEKAHYKPETLDMDLDTDTADFEILEQFTMTKENCEAGSPSLNKLDKRFLSSGDSKLNESNTDYEKLLFTTHGCPIYHHERILLNNQIDI